MVAQLRATGAVALGKTVTTESRSSTRSDHQSAPRHAYAGRLVERVGGRGRDGMVDVALGTQTAGSVIRPASFCGVFGSKPTFGSVTTAGMKFVAPSLDTIGWFARDVALVRPRARPC